MYYATNTRTGMEGHGRDITLNMRLGKRVGKTNLKAFFYGYL